MIRIWFKHYHTCNRGLMYDGEEALFRLSGLWWNLWIDKGWPRVLITDLNWWQLIRRRTAIRGHLFLLNSSILNKLCWEMDHP